MKTIIYLKEVPFFKKFFGITLGIFGLMSFLTGHIIFGAIFFMLGINFILTEGIEIDLESKSFRNVKSIFGKNFGKWSPYPEFEYVSVFQTKESQRINFVTATTSVTSNIILLNLFYKGNKYFTVYKTTDKKDAFEVAEHLKLALDIDILDATEKEKKWL